MMTWDPSASIQQVPYKSVYMLTWSRERERERERDLRREGGNSLLAYVKGVDPYLIHIDRPTTIRSPEHISGWVNYPPAYVIWVVGCVARTAGRGDVPYDV